MRCSACGKKIRRRAGQCKHCGAEVSRRQKANKLGNCAIVFAFLMPPLGVIFGILSLCIAPIKRDKTLRNDGIKAIIMSVVVAVLWVLLLIVLASLGVVLPVFLMGV